MSSVQKGKENTYILALDGDTDFQPSAVMLLVDRLRMYPEVGAACGRIHPTGTGKSHTVLSMSNHATKTLRRSHATLTLL